MIQFLQDYDGGAAARGQLEQQLSAHLRAVLASRGGGDLTLVPRAEAEVKRDPRGRIRFDAAGLATVTAAGRTYQGGRFETVPLGELRRRAQLARERAGRPPARLRLWVLDGASPLTDIGALQAAAPPDSLFQVASQFNCLESPGPYVTDVAHYASDPTQGPRASVSAFPATLVRHYAAPRADGTRLVQASDGEQVNLLADVCRPGVAAVRNGYLRAADVADPPALARTLEEQFDAVRVGVHDEAEVVLGYDWDGRVEGPPRTIAQVFTSTIAGGMYGPLDVGVPAWGTVCRQLQRAAYLGTLLAAAALGKRHAVLTLIGGGVFRNPVRLIWEALLAAADEVPPLLGRDLVVAVNGYNLGGHVPAAELEAAAGSRGGALVRCDRDGASVFGP
jgi:hypothetical protein